MMLTAATLPSASLHGDLIASLAVGGALSGQDGSQLPLIVAALMKAC
jgi:hypothetical protein